MRATTLKNGERYIAVCKDSHSLGHSYWGGLLQTRMSSGLAINGNGIRDSIFFNIEYCSRYGFAQGCIQNNWNDTV